MAKLLARELSAVNEITITQKIEANAVFAIVPQEVIPVLQQDFFFYVWNEATHEVRWMTSWDTTEADIHAFVELVKKTV